MREQDKALTIAIAEFMGLSVEWDDLFKQYQYKAPIKIDGSTTIDIMLEYSPVTGNGTQLNEFVEKVGMSISYNSLDEDWNAEIDKLNYFKSDKSRTKATLFCAAEFLGVEWS